MSPETLKPARHFSQCGHTAEEIEAINALEKYEIGREVIAVYDSPEWEDTCFDDVMYRVTYETGCIFDDDVSPDHAGYNQGHKKAIKRWVNKYAHLCSDATNLEGWAPGQWGA